MPLPELRTAEAEYRPTGDLASKYVKSKDAEWNRFRSFLASYENPRTFTEALPQGIVMFYLYKARTTGRAFYHAANCVLRSLFTSNEDDDPETLNRLQSLLHADVPEARAAIRSVPNSPNFRHALILTE